MSGIVSFQYSFSPFMFVALSLVKWRAALTKLRMHSIHVLTVWKSTRSRFDFLRVLESCSFLQYLWLSVSCGALLSMWYASAMFVNEGKVGVGRLLSACIKCGGIGGDVSSGASLDGQADGGRVGVGGVGTSHHRLELSSVPHFPHESSDMMS